MVIRQPELDVAWKPHPKQSEFLSAAEFEVLYGGAAGGGKTDGLLVDALGLQQDAIGKRNYQAIIFRRTYPDLKDIIDRSHEIYGAFAPNAKYDKAAHVWHFASGARIEFGFIQRDIERFRYRGRAFQYVGWEELTLWPTMYPYIYLMSRIRTTDSSLQCYVRGTTNPDGPGFKWVKDYWRIQVHGRATKFDVQIDDEETGQHFTRTRRFIPARVEDNPSLGQDYLITLAMLPEEEKNALRKGRWETPRVKGAIYENEMRAAREAGRICKVPHQQGLPVNTFWDLGANDTTAIWCHQWVALQNRFLTCMEASMEGLSFYVKWLLEQPYVYGTHYLPHDADHKRLGKEDTRSWKEMLEALLPGHTFEIVPRVEEVGVGINLTRDKFGNSYFDDEKCAEGISALENYQYKWDEDQQVFRSTPLHNWASNYADAFRQFGQCEDIGRQVKGFNRKKKGWRAA